jgi:hypothetical protein
VVEAGPVAFLGGLVVFIKKKPRGRLNNTSIDRVVLVKTMVGLKGTEDSYRSSALVDTGGE